MYGGGMGELASAAGRSSCSPRCSTRTAPNDTAPGGYNADPPRRSCPSPLPPEPAPTGFRRTRVTAYLDELMRRLEQHAGDELVAAWLVGSTALGDFDMTRSDVDVQAVAETSSPVRPWSGSPTHSPSCRARSAAWSSCSTRAPTSRRSS